MNNTHKAIGFGGLIALMFLTAFALVNIPNAEANPSEFTARARTATATTTLLYPANATSSLTYDSFNVASDNPTNTNQCRTATDAAQLNVQFSASSSASRICRRVLYSVDNVDYYPVYNVVTSAATSSNLSGIAGDACFNFASTSDAFVGSQTTGRYTETIPMLLRFAKVQFYIPTVTKAGIYAEVTPIKEVK